MEPNTQPQSPLTPNWGQSPLRYGNAPYPISACVEKAQVPSMGVSELPNQNHTPRAPPPAAPPPPPPVPTSTMVETVSPEADETTTMPHQSMAGSGIDARSPTDPSVTAEQRALSLEGGGASLDASNNGRMALLHQALACHLCQFLVNDFLENVSLPEIKDPAGGKVHAISLLKLLTTDPGYGLKFKLILQDIPAWSEKYKSQDHSLLLATSKRTDYFLTAGEQENPTLMLTGGNNAKEEQSSA